MVVVDLVLSPPQLLPPPLGVSLGLAERLPHLRARFVQILARLFIGLPQFPAHFVSGVIQLPPRLVLRLAALFSRAILIHAAATRSGHQPNDNSCNSAQLLHADPPKCETLSTLFRCAASHPTANPQWFNGCSTLQLRLAQAYENTGCRGRETDSGLPVPRFRERGLCRRRCRQRSHGCRSGAWR